MKSKMNAKISITNVLMREFLAEFLGTFILVLFTEAAMAQSVFSNKVAGDYFSVCWGSGMAVFLGILVSGGVSGAHLNPAVTLGFALWGKCSWIKAPVYMTAQYIGGFIASSVVYAVYLNALDQFESRKTLATAGIWATYPGTMTDGEGIVINNFLFSGNGLVDQVVASAVLMICICAINDKRNLEVPKYLTPLLVGLLIVSMANSFGLNCGAPLNPARDLAPRIFTLIAGWGEAPFTSSTRDGIAYWWIPLVGPHIGVIIGAGIYIFFIEIHHDTSNNNRKNQKLNAVHPMGS